jgi:hypothetical protein
MPVIIDGTNGVSTPNTFAFKNRIIDGGFTINQRGYTSGTSLSSGSYGHDRWKGGASGGTYTFTQGSTGVNTTITITAGSIIQVIEGANLPEGGTYVLSWTGTAQGKIGSGSFGASGITGTITAGTNTNIEFNTGTCGNVQLEVGSTATSFDYRPYGTELALCQRYYYLHASGNGVPVGMASQYGASSMYGTLQFPVTMRIAPTISSTSGTDIYIFYRAGAADSFNSLSLQGSSTTGYAFLNNSQISGTSGQAGWVEGANASAFVAFGAEL